MPGIRSIRQPPPAGGEESGAAGAAGTTAASDRLGEARSGENRSEARRVIAVRQENLSDQDGGIVLQAGPVRRR